MILKDFTPFRGCLTPFGGRRGQYFEFSTVLVEIIVVFLYCIIFEGQMLQMLNLFAYD